MPETLDPGTAAPAPQGQEVIVVDDHPVTRYATTRMLQAAGFQVLEAGTGNEALALASADTSAMVLDVNLPDIDGFEVCRRLRARDDTRRMAIIHLSAAHVSVGDKVRGLEAGADAYITHPAEPALLVATIQALLRARMAEEAMRRSESKFRAIHDLASIGICLLDGQGRFVDANPALLDLLQRTAPEIIGRPVSDFAPPEWTDHVREATSVARVEVWRGEFPLRDASGGLVHLSWSLRSHVEPGITLGVAANISDRVALDRQRENVIEREQAARATAERLSRSKDDFIAVLSHELRTPLNAILGWTHVLQKRELGTEAARGLAAIERNAKTQTRLISDILDVSRINLGKLRLDREAVDPGRVLRDAANALAPQFAEKRVGLHLDLRPAYATAWLDPARFQQVAWNLLTNALKFSEPQGNVHVGLREGAGRLVLTVRDEGQGIRPEFLPYLFDRFTQSDSASNRYHGGLGLGLSIVKHLAELHGGTVTAFSDGPGRGSTFEVVMMVDSAAPPATVDDSTAAAASAAGAFAAMAAAAGVASGVASGVADAQPGRAPALAPPADARPVDAAPSGFPESELPGAAEGDDLHGLDVLVVDDDAEASGMLTMILGDRGARVRSVGNVDAALRALASQHPDVMVSDIGMPGRDGYDLVREVRRREAAGPHAARPLRAIALTAFAREADRALALSAGFDAHCSKPLRPQELIGLILGLVGKDGELRSPT